MDSIFANLCSGGGFNFMSIFTLRIKRMNLTFTGIFYESLECMSSVLAYYTVDFTVYF